MPVPPSRSTLWNDHVLYHIFQNRESPLPGRRVFQRFQLVRRVELSSIWDSQSSAWRKQGYQ